MKKPNAAQLAQFEEVWEMEKDVRLKWNYKRPSGSRLYGTADEISERLRDSLLQEHVLAWVERGCPKSFYPTDAELRRAFGDLPAQGAGDEERDSGRTGFSGADKLGDFYGEHDFNHDWNQ